MTKQPKPEMASQSRPGPGYVVPGLRALASTAELPEVPKNMHQVVSFSQCVCVCVRERERERKREGGREGGWLIQCPSVNI